MSKKELLQLVSRAFALLLLSWLLLDITYMPEKLFTLFHHQSQSSVLATHDYWSSLYLIETIFYAVRLLALSFAAAWFWKCGPRVEALFSPWQSEPPSQAA